MVFCPGGYGRNWCTKICYNRFQNRDGIDNTANDNVFCRSHVISAKCIFGTERFPETGINTEYADHNFFQAYGKPISCFGLLSKDNTFQPYISPHDFRRDGNFICIFDIRY